MERIKYRITLDTHRTGIQRTLQGFETADKMARSIAINLVAGGDSYEIPTDNIVAMMYVVTPNAAEPSINACSIEDNTVIYDVLPIVEEGITEMQLKIIETGIDGAKKVLASPRFAVEVTEGIADDDDAEQSTTFTALEDAIAKANGVYNARLTKVEIDEACVFRAFYADGTVYENFNLYNALYNGNALLSESWAVGDTGIREGENTNNSMYYSNVSKSSSIEASENAEMVRALTDMAKLYSTYTSFETNFETGNLEYISASHEFDVDESTGHLNVEGETFKPDEIVEKAVEEYLDNQTEMIDGHIISKDNPHEVTAEQVGARPDDWMPTAEQVGAMPIVNATSAEWDMDAMLAKSSDYTCYKVGSNTLGTPYKNGKSDFAWGWIFTYVSSENYGSQFAFIAGAATPFQRIKNKGIIGEWTQCYLPLTGGTLIGNLRTKRDSPANILENSKATKIGIFKLFENGNVQICGSDSTNGAWDGTNTFDFQIRPADVQSILAERVTLGFDGTYYKMYGAHNITAGTSTVPSSLTTDAIYQQYS